MSSGSRDHHRNVTCQTSCIVAADFPSFDVMMPPPFKDCGNFFAQSAKQEAGLSLSSEGVVQQQMSLCIQRPDGAIPPGLSSSESRAADRAAAGEVVQF
jgi:hypothetical protein